MTCETSPTVSSHSCSSSSRAAPGAPACFVWDASGLMGLAADVGAPRNAPVIFRLLQLFPTPTLGRCLSTLVRISAALSSVAPAVGKSASLHGFLYGSMPVSTKTLKRWPSSCAVLLATALLSFYSLRRANRSIACNSAFLVAFGEAALEGLPQHSVQEFK